MFYGFIQRINANRSDPLYGYIMSINFDELLDGDFKTLTPETELIYMNIELEEIREYQVFKDKRVRDENNS